MSASVTLKWLSKEENVEIQASFISHLIMKLQKCIPESCISRKKRELMWEAYYQLRSSQEFQELWTNLLLHQVKTTAHPIFYQYVTDLIFEKLIKSYSSTPPPLTTATVSIDYFEANALRYMAGYVVRSLR